MNSKKSVPYIVHLSLTREQMDALEKLAMRDGISADEVVDRATKEHVAGLTQNTDDVGKGSFTAMVQETLRHFAEGMYIHQVALYDKPGHLQLFISPDQDSMKDTTILGIVALDSARLKIEIQGPHAHESPHDHSEMPEVWGMDTEGDDYD